MHTAQVGSRVKRGKVIARIDAETCASDKASTVGRSALRDGSGRAPERFEPGVREVAALVGPADLATNEATLAKARKQLLVDRPLRLRGIVVGIGQ